MERSDIRRLVNETADAGKPREAEKRRQTVGAMFRWALSEDLVATDPTAGLRAYDPGTPRERTLSYDEIRIVWQWLADTRMPPGAADVLRLQLATGARCGELGGMSAEEIDTTNWTWTLPAARSKNKRSRLTPLTGLARDIIEARLATTTCGPLFVTETGKPLSSADVGHALLSRELPVSKFTTHDLRRTVATRLVEMGISAERVATLLGHESGARQTRTLIRHYVHTDQLDNKTVVLKAWDRELCAAIEGRAEKGNVVSLHEEAA